MRAHRDAVVEINDILIEQAYAAARDGVADTLRLVGAVQADAASVGPIARYGCHHVGSRCPTGPTFLAPDHRATAEIQGLGAAYADRVTPISLHQIKAALGHDDHDAARTLMAAPCNLLAHQAWVGEINLRDCEGTVLQHGSGNWSGRRESNPRMQLGKLDAFQIKHLPAKLCYFGTKCFNRLREDCKNSF
jgi:hypothetical protein